MQAMSLLRQAKSVLRKTATFLCNNSSITAPVVQLQHIRWESSDGTTDKNRPARSPLQQVLRRDREFRARDTFVPQHAPYRYGYESTRWTGGLLPRHKTLQDKPVFATPNYNAYKANAWTRKKALFGQNDYIDILGDGRVHPYETMKGPEWLKGFRGNELQRIVRQMEFAGSYLRDMRPQEYFLLQKRMWFLFKKFNKRHVRRPQLENPEQHADKLPAHFKSRFDLHYRRYTE